MSALPRLDWISEEEYLTRELLSDIRHEYIEGKVYAMVGAHKHHNLIANNLFGLFWNHLAGKPCIPYTSDMKVKVGKNFFYPDVMVDCSDDNNDYFTQSPTILVEVLSKSTRQHDKTFKREQYLKIPTLQEYILVEQDFVDVEIQRRRNGWQSEHFYLNDEVEFTSIACTTTVAEIYQRVNNDDMLQWLEKQQSIED